MKSYTGTYSQEYIIPFGLITAYGNISEKPYLGWGRGVLKPHISKVKVTRTALKNDKSNNLLLPEKSYLQIQDCFQTK